MKNNIKLNWISPAVTNLNAAERIETGTPSVSTIEESTAFNSAYTPQTTIGGCGSATTGTAMQTIVSVCTVVSTYATVNTNWAPPDGNFTTNVGTCTGAASATTTTNVVTVVCS